MGCEIISIENEPMVPSSLINNLMNRPSFLVRKSCRIMTNSKKVDENYKQRITQILNKYPLDVQMNTLFVKTYLSTFLPYPSETIVKDSDVDKEEFKKIFEKIDYQKLECIFPYKFPPFC